MKVSRDPGTSHFREVQRSLAGGSGAQHYLNLENTGDDVAVAHLEAHTRVRLPHIGNLKRCR